jgi:hypothetical protein
MSLTRLQQRLLVYTAKNADNDCWQWTGQISNSGYGRLKVKDLHGELCMQSAHQLSYEAFIGPLPEGKRVMQRCRNRLCINPDHLELFDPLTRRPS